jgi:hypothetical protein
MNYIQLSILIALKMFLGVALGINCIQCNSSQLELLRNAGAMPLSSRRCGMITKSEAERLVKSFLEDIKPPRIPPALSFDVEHECGHGSRGTFFPSLYNSSRAKCIRCFYCSQFFSPNKFIFHSHDDPAKDPLRRRLSPTSQINQHGLANFNSWRRHITIINEHKSEELNTAWEEVKTIFNGGKRKRFSSPIMISKSSIESEIGNEFSTKMNNLNHNLFLIFVIQVEEDILEDGSILEAKPCRINDNNFDFKEKIQTTTKNKLKFNYNESHSKNESNNKLFNSPLTRPCSPLTNEKLQSNEISINCNDYHHPFNFFNNQILKNFYMNSNINTSNNGMATFSSSNINNEIVNNFFSQLYRNGNSFQSSTIPQMSLTHPLAHPFSAFKPIEQKKKKIKNE